MKIAALLTFAVLVAACGIAPAPPAWDPGPAWDTQLDTALRHTDGYLVCIRRHESDRGDANGLGLHDAGYQASNGSHFGAYQFAPATWDTQAVAIDRGDLSGRRPDTVGIVDQDLIAWTLSQGTHAPWAGSGC